MKNEEMEGRGSLWNGRRVGFAPKRDLLGSAVCEMWLALRLHWLAACLLTDSCGIGRF